VCGDIPRARRQSLFVGQVQKKCANIFGTYLLRRPVEVSGQLGNVLNVARLRLAVRLRMVMSSIIRWRSGDTLRAAWLLLGEIVLLMESNDIPAPHSNLTARVRDEGSGLSDCRGAA